MSETIDERLAREKQRLSEVNEAESMASTNPKGAWEKLAFSVANSFYSDMVSATAPWYNPPTGRQFMQDVNYSPLIPSQDDLTTWLKDPANNEIHLRGVSQYLENAIMQYKRTLNHFSRILSFNNELIPIDVPQDLSDEATVARWKWGYLRCMDFLKKFNLKYQKDIVMAKTVSEGGIFVYLTESKDFATLTEIPSNWCYITGRTDIGWSYGINLAYFDKYVGMREIMPELYNYYKKFTEMRDIYNNKQINKNELFQYQFYKVPPDKGYVFTLDILRADITPPLKGCFKDAVSIIDYKNLLKQKAVLDTWKIVAQIIPRNDKNEPAIDEVTVKKFIQATQLGLPTGVRTIATPMDVIPLDFNNAQNMNNIVGIGETQYWKSVGVNGVIMDGAEKTVEAVRSSLKNDVGFVDSIYEQFENFINIQLLKLSREFRFRISIFGDRYTDAESMKNYQALVTSVNFPVSRLFAYAGYQPYEVEGIVNLESITGIKEKLTPILSAFNTKGVSDSSGNLSGSGNSKTNQTKIKKSGRARNESIETDGAAKTEDYQSNIGKKGG